VINKSATHEVRIDPISGNVVKRFRSWSRGEPVREWTALTLLAELAPGLAPAPVSADLSGGSPTLVMSWLPGAELGAGPITTARARALADALERLWRSVPSAERRFPPSIMPNPGLDAGQFLSLFNLTRAEAARVHDFRCLAALFWLIMLRPGSTSSTRNPPGTLERQARRLLELLG
jgi:hypothetical protein